MRTLMSTLCWCGPVINLKISDRRGCPCSMNCSSLEHDLSFIKVKLINIIYKVGFIKYKKNDSYEK